MFMDHNRKVNNAHDPAPAPNKKARQIAANGPMPGPAETELFTPDMSSPAAINEAHYQGGVSGAGPYGKSYEDKIPFTGERPEGGDTLKSR